MNFVALALVSSWGREVCPSDCSCERLVIGASPARESSLGHEIEPSACSSKWVAWIAGLARVASWGKAKALSLGSRLEVGDVCGLGVGKSDGEERQSTQEGRGLKNERRGR